MVLCEDFFSPFFVTFSEEESLPVHLQHIGPLQKKNLNPVPPERRRQHRHQPNGNAASIFRQEDQEIGSSSELFSRPSANRPNVIIEEFMEESESGNTSVNPWISALCKIESLIMYFG